MVGRRPRLPRWDCSGFVIGALACAGLPVWGNTASLYKEARAQRRLLRKPEPGALVFFDATYDRNRNGRLDDPLTHIAIVTRVDADQTAHLVHLGSSQGISKLRMNLRYPTRRKLGRKTINSVLASNRGQPLSKRLTSAVFRGFARVERSESMMLGLAPAGAETLLENGAHRVEISRLFDGIETPILTLSGYAEQGQGQHGRAVFANRARLASDRLQL